MSKPIYLPVELCQKLQAKGLECGSGMWWFYYVPRDLWGLLDYLPENAKGIPAYELHIDILGSRENLVKLFGEKVVCELCGGELAENLKCQTHPLEAGFIFECESNAHFLLDLILDDESDKAINLIKEAV